MTSSETSAPPARSQWWDRMQALISAGHTAEQAADMIAPSLEDHEVGVLIHGYLEGPMMALLNHCDGDITAADMTKWVSNLVTGNVIHELPLDRGLAIVRHLLVNAATVPDGPGASLLLASGCRELAAGLRAAVSSGDPDVIQHAALEAVAGLDDLGKRLRNEE